MMEERVVNPMLQEERQKETYEATQRVILKWPSWKREIIDRHTQITPAMKDFLSTRKR